MINFILLFGSFIICSQTTLTYTKLCDVCIIDSTCTDEQIYFNVSISEYCQEPLHTFFTYHTDVNSKPHNYNTTSTCSDCYISIEIDPVRDAWDYTLTLKEPKSSNSCPTQHVAHCGGDMSQLVWYIVAGLSGLFVILGLLLWGLKHCHRQIKKVKVKRKKIEVAVINA